MTRESGARKMGRRSILATLFLLLCSLTAFGQSSRSLSYLALGDSYNITEISRCASTEPELVAEDGLHPSGEMYRLWVAQMVERIKKSLPRR